MRELKHAIEQASAFARGDELLPGDFSQLVARADMSPRRSAVPQPETSGPSSVSPERLREALSQCKGNRVEAAKILAISRSSLYRLLRQIEEPGEVPPLSAVDQPY